MICSSPGKTNPTEFLESLGRRVIAQRIPFNGSIDLTDRCNLSCVHCYMGTVHGRAPDELTTPEILTILDQIADAGCLNLLLTGGEPFLRKDFAHIYSYAKHLGFLIDIFSNGTVIEDDILRLFSDLPPFKIELTMHGSTAGTFEAISGVRGSFDRFIRTVHTLMDHHLPLGLKMIVMTVNRHEFDSVREFCAGLGVPFRYDTSIFPRMDGDRSPIELRIPPNDSVDLDLMDSVQLSRWMKYLEKTPIPPVDERLYVCGAGMQSFHVSSSGLLTPCVMMSEPFFDLRKGSFSEGWNQIESIRDRIADPSYACNRCSKRLLCGYCPAFFKLETGSEEIPSTYLCRTGHVRSDRFDKFLSVRRS